jgi:hypothetical protein
MRLIMTVQVDGQVTKLAATRHQARCVTQNLQFRPHIQIGLLLHNGCRIINMIAAVLVVVSINAVALQVIHARLVNVQDIQVDKSLYGIIRFIILLLLLLLLLF